MNTSSFLGFRGSRATSSTIQGGFPWAKMARSPEHPVKHEKRDLQIGPDEAPERRQMATEFVPRWRGLGFGG